MLPEPIPEAISRLPRDERGYPVPWFVAWIDGRPEFRVADAAKLALAIREKRCWVCGETLGHFQTFVLGPMCLVNRTTAEPPCHLACAEFSAKACPFLSKPRAARREAGLPEDCGEQPGIAIPRNPGVTVLYTCRGYNLLRLPEGVLFRPLKPVSLSFWREGRPATRAEIVESIDSGLPALQRLANEEGPEAVRQLDSAYLASLDLLPA